MYRYIYTYTYVYHKNQLSGSKITIHGSCTCGIYKLVGPSLRETNKVVGAGSSMMPPPMPTVPRLPSFKAID